MNSVNYFWAMNKAQKPLVWDTFTTTNKNSNKFFEIPHILRHSKIIDGDIYFDEDAVNDIRDSIRKNIEEDIDYPSKMAEKLYRLRDDVLKVTNKANLTNLRQLSDKELMDIFNTCFDQIGLIECFMSFRGNVQLSDVLTEKIKQVLASKLNKNNKLNLLEDYFLFLSIPKKESYMIRLQKDILRIANLIKKLYKDYSWTGCSMFDGDHISLEKFKDEIYSKLSLDCEEELKKQEKDKIDREEKIRRIVKELDFNEEEQKYLENLREWFFLRTYAKDCVSITVADTMTILYEIAKRMDIDKKDIPYLRKQEIKEIFETPKDITKDLISKRKERYGVQVSYDTIEFYSGEDVSKIEQKEYQNLNVDEIKGTIASKGKIRGIVRYLKNANELYKIKKGDILVTPMTTTDYTPILDKISGLITDEGGLTCHAAIVSRELGIPCIIGTKIATKVLKDGDKVELDANTGIIKKLSEEDYERYKNLV